MRLIDADELMMQFFQPPEFTVCPPDMCHDNVAVEAYKRGWNDAITAIEENAPTIDPVKHGEWIPVSERMPEEDVEVLACNEDGDMEVVSCSYSTEIDGAVIWFTSGWRFGKVLAWMPLPEAYKEET